MRVRPIASGEIALAVVARNKAARRDSAWTLRAIGGRMYYLHGRDAARVLRVVNDRRLDLQELRRAQAELWGLL